MVRDLSNDALALGIEVGALELALRNIPLEGVFRSAGLGWPRQLVAVGGIGKSSLPNSSTAAASGKELGVNGNVCA
jgi:hypothetical protein